MRSSKSVDTELGCAAELGGVTQEVAEEVCGDLKIELRC